MTQSFHENDEHAFLDLHADLHVGSAAAILENWYWAGEQQPSCPRHVAT